MKNIAFIMEHTTSRNLRNILLVYMLEVVTIFILIYSGYAKSVVPAILFLLMLFVWIHAYRIKKLVSQGTLNRILLLPIKRRSFMWSQLIFICASICLFLIILYTSWFSFHFLLSSDMTFQEILGLSYIVPSLNFLIPNTFIRFITLIIYVILLTVQTTELSLFIALKDKIGWTGNTVFFSWILVNDGVLTINDTFTLVCDMFMIVFIIFIFRNINKTIGFRQKKVKL